VRELAAARRQSGEGKIMAQGRKFGWRRWRLRFKGERRGGGARRGGRRVQAEQEREREKGGPGCDGDSTAARRRAAAGSVARTIVKGGGVGATRNGVTDRWAGTRWGPGR
jgi:hypothetical protein